ncbi:MAG: hypothetical protein WCH99_09910 [Verrucomicrobiota bacterium]
MSQIKSESVQTFEAEIVAAVINTPDGELGVAGVKESGKINSKPRFLVQSGAVINAQSGFKKKLLCDGLTFTAGHACAFSCKFCYVEAMIFKKNKRLQAISQERGLAFEQMCVEIEDAPAKARKYLTRSGKPRYADENDNRVIFASPLVDVAATVSQVNTTVEICNAILELTHWQIRLLSKSPLLVEVAKRIPAQHKNRVIYGLSTGTMDSDLTKAFEIGTGLVSKRLAALKWLQENGYRTFGMICPILPQADYSAFAQSVAQNIDIAKCEHVWAESMNVRGDSLTATVQALRGAGRNAEADLLEKIATDKSAWEESARNTFEALAQVIPGDKLRFLQYVNAKSEAWWTARKDQGAVVLAKKPRKQEATREAVVNGLTTEAAS